MSTITWTLGELLSKARRAAGFDQIQLAERVGVARNTISNYETGRAVPQFDVVVRWAHATGTPLEFFAHGVETTEAPVDFSTEASGLSQHSVRSKGLEPPTFWLVVKGWFEQRRFDREFARITKGLGL